MLNPSLVLNLVKSLREEFPDSLITPVYNNEKKQWAVLMRRGTMRLIWEPNEEIFAKEINVDELSKAIRNSQRWDIDPFAEPEEEREEHRPI